MPPVLAEAHYACAANGFQRSRQKPSATYRARALGGGSGRGLGAAAVASSGRAPSGSHPLSAGHAPSTASRCPRGPPSQAVSGLRLGVPDACGFLWEETARGPLSLARILRGPGGGDPATALAS